MIYYYESKVKKDKAYIEELEKEKDVLQNKISKYWHRWRTSKKKVKALGETQRQFNTFSDHLLKIISTLKSERLDCKRRLAKFARKRDLKTGKYIKK